MQWFRSLALLFALGCCGIAPVHAQKHAGVSSGPAAHKTQVAPKKPAAQAVGIRGVRVWRAPDNTRLVFDLSGPAEHKLFDMPGENGRAQRLVINIDNARFAADTAALNFAGSPVASLQHTDDGQQERVVIELNARVKPKSFVLPANNQYGDRLVLDLFDADVQAEVKTVPPPSSGLRDVIIAVDPGHGGEDPGAAGPGGVHEKNVTLAIARQLVNEINDKPGYTAFLTRSGDYFVSLRGRTQIARKKNADFFLSIHADAFKDNTASGASVFALSQRGATSETARWLEQSENDADLVGGVNLGDKDPMLQEVLLDLSMTATVSNSLDMGAEVLGQLKRVTPLHRGFVEQAGFVVLKSPDIPSLLVETGFITNAGEARNLTSPDYQKKLAKAVFAGVDKYIRRKPPMDTSLALNQRAGKHTAELRPAAVTTRKENASGEEVAAREAPVKEPLAEKTDNTASVALEQELADDDAAATRPALNTPSSKEPTETKPAETKPIETKPAEKNPEEKKLVEKKLAEKKSPEKKPLEKKIDTGSKAAKGKTPAADKNPEASRSPDSNRNPAVGKESGKESGKKTAATRTKKARTTTTHVVASGETLGGIALHYHISVATLRDSNQLGDGENIRAGQTLHIPAAD